MLSADRKLQKLSLKRMSELKKSAEPARSTPSKQTAAAKPPARPRWAMSPPAIALGVIGVVAAAALITAGQPSPGTDGAGTGAPRVADASFASAPAPARAEPPKPAAAKAPVTPVVSKAPAPRGAAPEAPPAAPAAAPVTAQSAIVAAVTVTGCVERDGETYWLKDTSGADAPKSRSWRSGFLKKRPSRVELVDATDTLRLSSLVGRRVAATGVLTNREMQARSLRSVAASCN
jgi:hypothetical protein